MTEAKSEEKLEVIKNEKVKKAILSIYDIIDQARENQKTEDQGLRKGMTSGQHLNPIADLIAEELIARGVNPEKIFTTKGNSYLPGWFRDTKSWDFLAFYEDHLICAIELKSINSSFDKNGNNRKEEALGNALDLNTAINEDLLGDSLIPPALGYVMVIKNDPYIHKDPELKKKVHFKIDPIFGDTTYLKKFDIFCSRLRKKNIYAAVWLVVADPDKGEVYEPNKELSYNKFIETIISPLRILKA